MPLIRTEPSRPSANPTLTPSAVISGNVAPGTDIAESEARVQAKIADVRAEIGGLDARLYQQLWIMAAGIVGLTVALVKLLG